jgi:imidazole glycerol-phosphate synthase subunit HisH
VGSGAAAQTSIALRRLGITVAATLNPEVLLGYDGIVLPGRMSFATTMQVLTETGLGEAVREACDAEIPILGIGVGMQVLFERSFERGMTEGLGILRGDVRPLSASGRDPVPHMGSKPVRWRDGPSLGEGLPDPCSLYHMHSFVVVPADDSIVSGWSTHSTEFASAVQSGSVFGVQFRPEVSRGDGLQLLYNYAAQCTPR